jgi:tripartite-type tricarboxylate transporter receptor subunit TctC
MRFPIAVLCVVCGQAAASSLPLKPRELVHPYPPTGPVEVAGTVQANKVLRTMQRYAVPAFTDVLAMHVAQALQGASGEPVVVTRKPRQSGNEAAANVSSAAADGRTLLLASSVPRGLPSAARAGLALRPVALVASMPYVLIASADSRHASLGDLFREVRVAPHRLLIASAGEQSVGHLAIELLRSRYAAPADAVAYNGGIAALQAVATKQVSAAVVPLPAALPYLSGGRLKALAGFEEAGWFGLFAPSATPLPVIRELNAALARQPASELTRQTFTELGLRLEHRGADTFAELLAREQRRHRGMTGITRRDGLRPPS